MNTEVRFTIKGRMKDYGTPDDDWGRLVLNLKRFIEEGHGYEILGAIRLEEVPT
jgi:hypothetical protein